MAPLVSCGSTGRRRRHRRHYSWLRNPCVVFFLSFVALGSLRFRVRTKRAASKLRLGHLPSQRHSPAQRPKKTTEQKRNEPQAQQNSDNNNKMLQDSTMDTILYPVVERGASFTRYQAVSSKTKQPISVQQWAALLGASLGAEQLVLDFCHVLQESPYQAYTWETPGVTPSSKTKPFEFVLVNSPELDAFATGKPDEHAFKTHFDQQQQAASTANVAAFGNLSGDALLIAPIPKQKDLAPYAHLAAFVRGAPTQQVQALWKHAAHAYLERLQQTTANPVWLSTNGLGVAWLHLRMDEHEQPKYYLYAPFKEQS